MGIRDVLDKLCSERILILDGPKGTMVQSFGLDEAGFRGTNVPAEAADAFGGADAGRLERVAALDRPQAGNNDLLCLTRPDLVRRIHEAHLEAGADIIQTNTFNASRFSQADFGAAHLVRDINLAAARIARAAADAASTPGKPRFVAGDLGPTSKTLSISHDADRPASRSVSFDEMSEAYAEQAEALIEGGVDLIMVETVFDTLNAKAAIHALKGIARARGLDIPLMLSMTITDLSGRNLSGQTVEAFLISVEHAEPFSVGLNCSLGAAQLRPYLEILSASSPYWTSAHPNAGLPNGHGGYDQGPQEFADLVGGFCRDGLVNIAGGCCGSMPEHIAALADAAAGLPPRRPPQPTPTLRLSGLEPLVFGGALPFANIGERANVAGSRKFLRHMREGDYRAGVDMAVEMASGGSQMLDVCMDDGMLDAKAAMGEFLNLLAAEPEAARLPLVIDSSDFEVIIEGLKRVQGKSLVNSISLKEGPQAFLERARVLRDLGAAAIVMLFDENGQADSFQRKIDIAARSYTLLKDDGFPPHDIVFDPNVLAIATGMEEHRRYALDFIRACAWIKAELPGARVSGGVSNLSFAFRGNEPVRRAMHAVFLRHAMEAGLDMAILNPAQLDSYDAIEPELLALAEDAVLDRRDDAVERLTAKAALIAADPGAKAAGDGAAQAGGEAEWLALEPAERLRRAVVRGLESRLEADIAEALPSMPDALALIEGPLMEGMERVGELFGTGKMFLPQVIKSARVMKRAVAILQPALEARRAEGAGSRRAKVLLATVKGDVHDIGKNIVGVILACNGFEVRDLGVMVEARTILDEAVRWGCDMIGLSGLITPSLNEMAGVARMMRAEGLDLPLMVGGAATSRAHTAAKIEPEHPGLVVHARDAAQAVQVARRLSDPALRGAFLEENRLALEREREAGRRRAAARGGLSIAEARTRAFKTDWRAYVPPRPAQPGRGSVTSWDLAELIPYIDWRFLYYAWDLGLDADPDADDERGRAARKLRDDARALLSRIVSERLLEARAVWAILPAAGEGDDILVRRDANPSSPFLRLPFLRDQTVHTEAGRPCPCLSDYIAPASSGREDWLGFFALSAGFGADDAEAAFKAAGDDYSAILLKTLADRLAEALAELLHQRVRRFLWAYAPTEDIGPERLFAGAYRGIRPAPGYPACPDHRLKSLIWDILRPGEIGMELTSSWMMRPGASVCGFYFSHPESAYFGVGDPAPDQLADYARRWGLGIEEVKAGIAPMCG